MRRGDSATSSDAAGEEGTEKVFSRRFRDAMV